MKRVLFLMAVSLSVQSLFSGEEESKKRVLAHLMIQDAREAVVEAKRAVEKFPESQLVRHAYISALCENGEEMEAWDQWDKTRALNVDVKRDRRVLELLAWGVLNKAESSSQLNIRMNSLLGAAFTHDAKAIPLLIDQLRSSNALLRSIAVKLAVSYRDAPLKEEIARMLKEEQVWYVRLEVIQAVGLLRMESLKGVLKEIIANPKTLVEEKVSAILSLVSMYEHAEREELQVLSTSDRAGLRQLAVEAIAYLNQVEDLDLVIPLLRDSSLDVRISALNAIALSRIKEVSGKSVKEWLKPHLNDALPEVAITAAYALLLLDEHAAAPHFKKWLSAENPEWRRLASAALAASGKYGVSLAVDEIKKSNDSYVKANLALGLIGQRVEMNYASHVLYDLFFQEEKALWMWDHHSNPLFRSLAPSRVKHIEQIPHYPLVVDQLTRLDLLSVLSIIRYPKAQEAVKGFLQTRAWGVTGAAAATLLKEGDEEALAAVKMLLSDPDEKIRVQAALIMAMVGADPSAVQVLQEAYSHVDREMKIHILEALANVGDPSSIPFLVEILKEPFQILRVVAASALIQCLYH
jgi:HEAT repeat protein